MVTLLKLQGVPMQDILGSPHGEYQDLGVL